MECGQHGHHGASVTSRVKTVPGSGQEIAQVLSTMELNARDQTMKLRLASQKCVQVKCNHVIVKFVIFIIYGVSMRNAFFLT